jgi:hypothetical protein
MAGFVYYQNKKLFSLSNFLFTQKLNKEQKQENKSKEITVGGNKFQRKRILKKKFAA